VDLLTKKERGEHRYQKRRAYVGARRERSRRTRPSDIAPARITDGIPGNKETQVFTTPEVPKKFRTSPLSLFLQAVSQSKER
jgi:hypothetical protein